MPPIVDGVTAIDVDMAGAQGGTANYLGGGGIPGRGGRLQATVAVTPGEPLRLGAGSQGGNGAPGDGGAGGFYQAGRGGSGTLTGGGGGGGTSYVARSEIDGSSSGHDGAPIGTPRTPTSPWAGFGSALRTDGVDRDADTAGVISDPVDFSSVGALTLRGKVEVHSFPTGTDIHVIAAVEDDGGGNNVVQFLMYGDGNFLTNIFDSSGNVVAQMDTPFSTSQTVVDFEVTWDGTDWYLFIDGELEDSVTHGINASPAARISVGRGAFHWGQDPQSPYPSDVTVDDFSVSTIARHTADFTTSSTPTAPDTDTLLAWSFDKPLIIAMAAGGGGTQNNIDGRGGHGRTATHDEMTSPSAATDGIAGSAANGGGGGGGGWIGGTGGNVSQNQLSTGGSNYAHSTETSSVTSTTGFQTGGGYITIRWQQSVVESYTYDQANRLIDTDGVTYDYNGDGLRTSTTDDTTSTEFTWSQDGGLKRPRFFAALIRGAALG